jgi:hypothetical protein
MFWRNILPLSSGQYVPLKHWYLPISPHGIVTQKTNIDISPLWEPQISYRYLLCFLLLQQRDLGSFSHESILDIDGYFLRCGLSYQRNVNMTGQLYLMVYSATFLKHLSI